MKTFLAILLVVAAAALATAEPPAYRLQNRQQRRYFFERQEEAATPEVEQAPYSPSGWRPDGPTFDLPQRQLYGAPSNGEAARSSDPVDQYYGVPNYRGQGNQPDQATFDSQSRYNVEVPRGQFAPPQPDAARFNPVAQPDQTYGPPEVTTTTTATVTTEIPTTTEAEEATTTSSPNTDAEVEPVNTVNELDEEGDLDEQVAQRQQGQYYVALPDGRLQQIRFESLENLEAMKFFAKISASTVEPLRGPVYAYSPLQQLEFGTGVPLAPAAFSSASEKLQAREEISAPLGSFARYSYEAAPSRVAALSRASAYSSAYGVPRAPVAVGQRYIVAI